MKIILLVLAGGNSEHICDTNSQRATWGQNSHPNVQVFWVYGNSKDKNPDLPDILSVECEEIYSNLLRKTILATRLIEKTIEFDFLVRTNASSYFNLEMLSNLFENLPRAGLYGGFGQTFKNAANDTTQFVNGAGIYMSEDVIRYLNSIDIDNFNGIPDDVAIGMFIRQKYQFTKIKINQLCTSHIFKKAAQIRVKSRRGLFSYSPDWVSGKRMKLLDDYFQAITISEKFIARSKIQFFEIFTLEQAYLDLRDRSKAIFNSLKVGIKRGNGWL